jgi:hypothetical protein
VPFKSKNLIILSHLLIFLNTHDNYINLTTPKLIRKSSLTPVTPLYTQNKSVSSNVNLIIILILLFIPSQDKNHVMIERDNNI